MGLMEERRLCRNRDMVREWNGCMVLGVSPCIDIYVAGLRVGISRSRSACIIPILI